MLDATKPEQPCLMAVELHSKFIALKDQVHTCRAMAASLRREAKNTKLKVDAEAMKTKAKELSSQAGAHLKAANKARTDFMGQAQFVHQLLTQRMPPPMEFLGRHQGARLYRAD